MKTENGSICLNCYSSIAAMREAHGELLARRDNQQDAPEFLDDVQIFITQGQATGVLLDNHLDRRIAQSMLGYWGNVLYRHEREISEIILAEFDPMTSPEILDELCPYVGLEAFQEKDKPNFFGRSQLIDRLSDHLKENRLLAVIGPSGSGKSSVVLGGLVPALKEGAVSDSSNWRYYPRLVPGSKPLENLAQLISSYDGRDDFTAEDLKTDSNCLHRLVSGGNALPALFIIDQFEEIFTLVGDDKARLAFVDNFLRLVDAPEPKHIVILTMRTDFESHITRIPALEERFENNSVRVTPLNARELRDAIEKPAEMIGLKFDEKIVDELLKDILGEPAALPLLQFCLLKLWEKRERNRITWEAYRTLGSGRTALANSADALYKNLIPEEQDVARHIFMRLVRPGEQLEVTSNRIPLKTLCQIGLAQDRIKRVLNKLVKSRLLRISQGIKPDDAQVEVAHEALVRNWPTLLNWIEDEREVIRGRFRVTEAAELWLQRGRDASVLLRGRVLAEALRRKDFGDLETAFLKASVAAEEHSAAEKEAQRQKELEQARKRAKLQQRINLILAVFFLVAVGQAAVITLKTYRLEYERTEGQIKDLKESALQGEEKRIRTKTAFDSVTTYLWCKKDEKSTEKLVRLLKNSEELLRYYPVVDDNWIGYVMPFVAENTPWPIMLRYNPKQEFNQGLLQYQWRQMASSLAYDWGIPAPMRLKLKDDKTIPKADIHVLLDKRADDLNMTAQLLNQDTPDCILKELPFLGHRLLITQDKLPKELKKFFEEYQDQFTLMKHLEFNGPWWLVPRWTLPLWKIAGHGAFPKEHLVAVTLANKILEKPELVLTEEAVKFLLERERSSSPNTVEEVLSAHGGAGPLQKVFVEIVRGNNTLKDLRYRLDLLAEYNDISAAEMAEKALQWDTVVDDPLFKLNGQKNGRVQDSGQENSRPDPTQSDPDFQGVYEEAGRWLPGAEPFIRVYIGKKLEEKMITHDDRLRSFLLEKVNELRAAIYRRFGIIVPGVHFCLSEELDPNEFQMLLMDQTSNTRSEDVKPVQTVPDLAIERLEKELMARFIGYRIWWLTPEAVDGMLTGLPENLRNWLGKRYSLTDLKLVMRALILPDIDEPYLYNDHTIEEVFERIPPENSLVRFSWLLGSLAFWANICEPLDGSCLAERLRSTQGAYLNPVQAQPSNVNVSALISRGIRQIEAKDFDSAANYFKSASRINQNAAVDAFLAQYPQSQLKSMESRLKDFEKDCSLPGPGSFSQTSPPSLQRCRELEIFLSDFGHKVDAKLLRKFQLYLLWGYLAEKFRNKAAVLQNHLLKEYTINKWGADQAYILAYLLLDAREPFFAPPEDLNQIRGLLSDAFSRWNEKQAYSAFLELIRIYETRPPIWFWVMLESLIELYPKSYWIPYQLGINLAFKGEGGSREDVQMALTLLDKAAKNLPNEAVDSVLGKINPTEQGAWLDLHRADFYRILERYGKTDHRDKPLVLLKNLTQRIPAEPQTGQNLPSLEDVYSTLSNLYQMRNMTQELSELLDNARTLFPESENFHYHRFFFALSEGNVGEAIDLAKKAQTKSRWNRQDSQFVIAMILLLTRTGEFEHEARKFLDSDHKYRDYIRMMLCWTLMMEGKVEQARELLEERRKRIKPARWDRRIKEGDLRVWREMLICHSMGELSEEEVFGFLTDEETFQSSLFSNVPGMSFSDFKCEAYFYDALFQSVTGDPRTRTIRELASLKKVVSIENSSVYEKPMARYLIGELEGRFSGQRR